MNSTKKLEILQKITDLLNQDPMGLYAIIGPKSIQFEITNDCNLRCNMCDRWKWGPDLGGNLTKEAIFSLLEELSKLGTQHILISGGEPLLRKDFKEIIAYINKKGIKFTVITNGVVLTKDIAIDLIKSDATIIISVDGSNNEIYSKIRGRQDVFDKIIENIKNLVEIKDANKKGIISMHFVIQKHNMNDVISFYNLAKDLGVDIVSYGIVHGPHIIDKGVGFNKENFHQLKDNIKKLIDLKKESNIQIDLRKELIAIHQGQISLKTLQSGLLYTEFFKKNPVPCLSLNYWALIDAFGDVYPCCYAYFDNFDYHSVQKLRNRLCFGNIHKTSFQKIWAGEKFNSFRNSMNPVKIDSYPKVCGNCGSYFFFKEKWDGINQIKKKIGSLYENIDSTLISIRDAILECFAKPIDRAPRSYESEIEKMIQALFNF